MPDFLLAVSTKRVRDRLVEQVLFDEGSGCWIFTGSPTRDRARITVAGVTGEAYKFFFAMANGRNPEGQLLHSCDTARCVNPTHVREGTAKENMREMADRGRSRNQYTDKKECKRGHEWSSRRDFYTRPNGQRECKRCKRERAAERRRGQQDVQQAEEDR